MKKNLTNFVVILAGFLIGLSVFKFNATYLKAERDPAAIQNKIFEISSLNSDEIKTQIQRKLVINASQNGEKQLAFNGFSSAICKIYSNIEVELVAEGVSVAGEPSVLKISYPCEAEINNPSEMAMLILPIDLMLKQKPKNTSYTFEGYKLTVNLQNSADEWPHTWIVRKVEFKNSTGTLSKEALFGRAPASNEAANKPIILEF